MRATAIPERARSLVRGRARHRCERCSVPAPNGHWHHRRSRSVRDEHTHCSCVGVWLCAACHTAIHANPEKSRETGFILPRNASTPWTMPYKTPLGWVLPDCDGGWVEAL